MPADISQFVNGLHEHKERMRRAAVKAVDQFGEHVIGDAQELCPVDTGALQASGTTEPAVINGDLVEKAIGFNVSYAAPVHENLTARHPMGEAKFLETAMNRNAPKFQDFVANRLKREMGE